MHRRALLHQRPFVFASGEQAGPCLGPGLRRDDGGGGGGRHETDTSSPRRYVTTV